MSIRNSRYRQRMRERVISPSADNHSRTALRPARIKGIPGDPGLVEGLPISDKSRTPALKLELVKSILWTCDGILRGLCESTHLMMLCFEGLRRSESAKRHYRDTNTQKSLVVVKTAENTPYNTICLCPDVRQAIEGSLEVLNRDLQRLRTGPDDPMFTSLSYLQSLGKRLAPSSVNEIVEDRLKEAKSGRSIPTHSLRLPVTTVALASGVPNQQDQPHLWHKGVATILRHDRWRAVPRNWMLDALPRRTDGFRDTLDRPL